MAVKKLIEIGDSGFNAEHWVLERIDIDAAHVDATLTVRGYKNKTSYTDGKSPIGVKSFKVPSGDFVLIASSSASGTLYSTLQEECWEWIKNHTTKDEEGNVVDSVFKNAIDVV